MRHNWGRISAVRESCFGVLVCGEGMVDVEVIVIVHNDVPILFEAHRNLAALVAQVEIISCGEVRPKLRERFGGNLQYPTSCTTPHT